MPAATKPPASQTVDLAALSPAQLAQLKKQLDDEFTHLTNSFQSLRTAQAKFRDCLVSVSAGGFAPAPGSAPTPTTPSSSSSASSGKQPSRGPRAAAAACGPPRTDILVPLTASLYVPGKLDLRAPFLIDVGTGFYVERTGPEAQDFYTRKITDLANSLSGLEAVLQNKARTLRLVEDALRQKAGPSGTPKATSSKKS